MMLALAGVWGSAAPVPPSLTGSLRIHDPSTILRCKDRYYFFGTGRGIFSKSSPDSTNWSDGPRVFDAPPSWTTNTVPGFRGHYWAPDVLFLNGRYRLCYSVSTWGSQVSAIGLVTNPRKIDDFQVWGRALSASETAGVKSSRPAPKDDPFR